MYAVIMVGVFTVFIFLDKQKNGGKNSPEAGFTYGMLSMVWPYWLCTTIYSEIKRFFRKG